MLLIMSGNVVMSKIVALMRVVLSCTEMYHTIDECHTNQSRYIQVQLYFSIHLTWIQSLGRWRQCVVPKLWNIQPPHSTPIQKMPPMYES
jgi:hypothetical protein